MGFKLTHFFIFLLILIGAFLSFQSFIQVSSHGEYTKGSSFKTRLFWVSKMQTWMRDEAREVPTGPDPLHHHSSPSQH